MRRALLVVNPLASEVTDERVRRVRRELLEATALEIVETEARGHATELARGAGRADAILVFSGDGVFNEVLNGVTRDVPLGFIPGGGTSVLPRALGLGRDPARVARRLAAALRQGTTRRISLGRVNGRRFGFCAGLGLDAEVVRRVDALGRSAAGKRPGDLAFVAQLVAQLAARRFSLEERLEIRRLGRASLALACNGPTYTYAGPYPVRATPGARFELGLDLAAPGAAAPARLALLLARLLGPGLAGSRHVLSGHDLDRLEVVCDRPTALHADGEDLGDVTEALFEAERGAVRILH